MTVDTLFEGPAASGTRESVSRALIDMLAEDIASAQGVILNFPTLDSESQKSTIISLEQEIRAVGAKVEQKALAEMGIGAIDDDTTIYEKLYFTYFLKQKMSLNHGLLQEKILDFQHTTTKELEQLGKSGIGDESNKDLLRCQLHLKICAETLEEIEKVLKDPVLETPYSIKIGIAFLLPSMLPFNNFHEEASSILRRNYLLVLGQIRDYGGDLKAESYHSRTPEKRRNSKEHQQALKEEKSAIKNLERISRSLPTSWLHASNTNLPLFLTRINTQNKKIYHQSIPKSDGAIGGHYCHTEDEATHIPFKHSIITSYSEFSDVNITHELGHRVNRLFPIIGYLEETFYLRRTTNLDGTRNKQIDGTDRRESDFICLHTSTDPYLRRERIIKDSCKYKVGKLRDMHKQAWLTDWWPDHELKESYEVLSTGLESVLMGSYGCLAGLEEHATFSNHWDDADLRHFILGILATV